MKFIRLNEWNGMVGNRAWVELCDFAIICTVWSCGVYTNTFNINMNKSFGSMIQIFVGQKRKKKFYKRKEGKRKKPFFFLESIYFFNTLAQSFYWFLIYFSMANTRQNSYDFDIDVDVDVDVVIFELNWILFYILCRFIASPFITLMPWWRRMQKSVEYVLWAVVVMVSMCA